MARVSATESLRTMEKDYLPTESQMALMCLDYLRDLRRAYKDPQDMLNAEGLHADWLTLAIYALSRSFSMQGPLPSSNKESVNYSQITMPVFNDAWMDSHRVLTDAPPVEQEEMMNPRGAPPKNLRDLPSLKEMTKQILLSGNSREQRDEGDEKKNSFERYGERDDSFFDSYTLYDYDDAHPSNANRFYLLDGLAGSANGRGPLVLGEVLAAGLSKLKAKPRLVAEDEMVETPLFDSFVRAVKKKGFFNDPEHATPHRDPQKEEERLVMQKAVYDERMGKVVTKFRSKLATKKEREHGDILATTQLADYHHSRRMKRVILAKSRPSNEQSAQLSPVAPTSPTSIERLDSNNFDAKAEAEAEKLKSSGNAYMQKKQYDSALECYTQALRICPTGPQSHVYFSNRAAALLSMKKFKEAIIDSERALSLAPTYGKAHARLGLAHFLLGDYRGAIEAYTVALKYEPDNKSSKSYLEKAAKKLAAMSDLEVPTMGTGLSTSYSIVSEWDKSKTTKSRSKIQGSSMGGAEKFKTLGNNQMAIRDYLSAFESYSTAIDMDPRGKQSHVYYSNRAAALCYLERYEEAVQDSEKAIEMQPKYGKGYARLGLAKYFLEDFEASIEAYETAIEYDPDNASSKAYLAKAKAKFAKEEEKRINVEEEARRLMKDPDMMHMAKKMLQTGQSFSELELLEDPEMKKFARKAMADPVMLMAIKNIQKVDPTSPLNSPR